MKFIVENACAVAVLLMVAAVAIAIVIRAVKGTDDRFDDDA
jgi:ABC-type sulfate transport system permease component